MTINSIARPRVLRRASTVLELRVRPFVVGTGGRSLADFGPPVPNSVVRYREAFGILAISLFADWYRWEFTTPDDVLFADRRADIRRPSCR